MGSREFTHFFARNADVLDVSSIGAVVFDLDGVLVDSESLNIASARAGFEAVGFPLGDDDVRFIVGRHPADYVPELMRRHEVPDAAFSKLRRVQEAAYLERHALVPPFPGAVELVERLSARRFRLAVATSSGTVHAREVLERTGILPHLEFVLGGDDVERRKPAPDIYLMAVERFGVATGQVLVIEDSEHGVAAARAAGLACVAVRSPHAPADTAATATHAVDSIAQVAGLFGLDR